MEKTLKTIQIFAKIGKVISKLVYVFSIVGGIGCAVALLCLAVMPSGSLKIGGVTLNSIIENYDMLETGKYYAALASAMVICAGEAALGKIACKSFETELEEGTPFSFKVADSFKHLGISAVWIPIASIVVSETVFSIIAYFTQAAEDPGFGDTASIGVGIVFIALSFICRYGAELAAEKQTQSGEMNYEEQ